MEKLQRGFTLIEVLIAVAIIIVLSIFVLINIRGQLARANDIKRKTDLYALRKSFEEYKNDYDAFPAESVINDNTHCGGADMAPYLAKIPCDPVSRAHYGYFLSVSGGYRICAKLADTTDPAIAAVGCGGADGCGLGEGYNYCLSSGVTASAVGTEDQIVGGGLPPTPTPGGATPTPYIGPHWACASTGNCNLFTGDPYAPPHNCGMAWYDSTCGGGYKPGEPYSGACAIPSNICDD